MEQAQKLYVKTKDEEGNEIQKESHIIAFWTDVAKGAIYLHENGVYGYKDGSPVRAKEELETIISQPVQRKYALLWWDKVGSKLSKTFYDKKSEEEERRISQALHVQGLGEAVQLDLVQYQRRPTKDRSSAAYGDPTSWTEWFTSRPDWWGLAKTIQIGDWYFRRCDPDENPDNDDQQNKPS